MNHARPVSLKEITITDRLWEKYARLVREKVIPYQWESLNDRVADADKSYWMHNMKVAAGLEAGTFGGQVFQDSDGYKWMEAVADSLAAHPDAKLEKLLDDTIRVIAGAQRPDGYLNTYFTLVRPESRFKNLYEAHELYCAGHFFEGAVAYYDATGKTNALEIARRLADYLVTMFGPGENQLHGYPGHPEIELALVKLYRATGEKNYLALAKYFIDTRGTNDYFHQEQAADGYFSPWSEKKPDVHAIYLQAHEPVRAQKEAVGHSVRAAYLYAGMADIAGEYADDTLLEACRTLYRNIVHRRMYVTGGIGSTRIGEQFTGDYDLPNDTAYAESCASIALMRFAARMGLLEGDASYFDTVERALYNTVLAGMAADGEHFFYVNPLEVVPDRVRCSPERKHVELTRRRWFGCACCPPNIARTLTQLGKYVLASDETNVYVNLLIASRATLAVAGGKAQVAIEANYPWDSAVCITAAGGRYALNVRIPAGTRLTEARVGAENIPLTLHRGYLRVERDWQGETLALTLIAQPHFVYANPQIEADAGCVAVQFGPFVYCAEEWRNGTDLAALVVDPSIAPQREDEGDLPGLSVQAEREVWPEDRLYRDQKPARVPTVVHLTPYFAWNNHGTGEMRVWLRQK